ncbi:hypothetical protein SDC9_150113 [bioreactor metagenome]|uniref:Uncharacterized protein n=1 Tax=bioreactor metagenome TaxID=1076179 RepID=A0A645ENQ3_9ZZZZ
MPGIGDWRKYLLDLFRPVLPFSIDDDGVVRRSIDGKSSPVRLIVRVFSRIKQQGFALSFQHNLQHLLLCMSYSLWSAAEEQKNAVFIPPASHHIKTRIIQPIGNRRWSPFLPIGGRPL